MFKLLGTLSF